MTKWLSTVAKPGALSFNARAFQQRLGRCQLCFIPILQRSKPIPLTSTLRHLISPARYLLGVLLVALPVKIIFSLIEVPYFSKMGVQLWSGNEYSWKQWPDWPSQLIAYLSRIIPQSLLPLANEAWKPLYKDHIRTDLFIALGIAVVLIVALAGIRSMRCSFQPVLTRGTANYVGLERPSALFLMAFGVTSLLLIPSWKLFGDPSVRYLTPYFPAVYVAIAQVARGRWSRVQCHA